ncbi:MAG: hypothetical protein COA46_07205 [Porticoccaceae bacterium]|nr:MAG: hypothetical protein COA46_07205 [Porticoccaceae bacterium]
MAFSYRGHLLVAFFLSAIHLSYFFSPLKNTQYVERTNALRHQYHNTAHRELNYPWVENHLNDEIVHGSKAY